MFKIRHIRYNMPNLNFLSVAKLYHKFSDFHWVISYLVLGIAMMGYISHDWKMSKIQLPNLRFDWDLFKLSTLPFTVSFLKGWLSAKFVNWWFLNFQMKFQNSSAFLFTRSVQSLLRNVRILVIRKKLAGKLKKNKYVWNSLSEFLKN